MALSPILLAVLAGALVAAQPPIYSRLSAGLGHPLWAAVAGFGLACAALLILMAVLAPGMPRLGAARGVPVWAWLGGLIGASVILISIATVPRLGAAGYLVAAIAGQLAAGLIYDRWGMFGLPERAPSIANLTGVALVLVGAVLVLRR